MPILLSSIEELTSQMPGMYLRFTSLYCMSDFYFTCVHGVDVGHGDHVTDCIITAMTGWCMSVIVVIVLHCRFDWFSKDVFFLACMVHI